MRELRVLAALAPVALIVAAPFVSTAALADDPKDPSMASRTARERDRAIIRKLNQDQLAYVRQRDARYAEGWDAYRRAHGESGSRRAEREDADYSDARHSDARGEYEEAMAQWREDVAACRAGYYEHCAR